MRRLSPEAPPHEIVDRLGLADKVRGSWQRRCGMIENRFSAM
jgi:hypothetical protein